MRSDFIKNELYSQPIDDLSIDVDHDELSDMTQIKAKILSLDHIDFMAAYEILSCWILRWIDQIECFLVCDTEVIIAYAKIEANKNNLFTAVLRDLVQIKQAFHVKK